MHIVKNALFFIKFTDKILDNQENSEIRQTIAK